MSSTTGQPEDGAKHPDRRIERTRRALMNALMDLIAEQGYEKTTVQGILDRANVGRSTFYAHYFNKQDLLLRGFALGRLGHDERADAESPDAPNLTALFAHAAQMREHVKGLEGSQAFEVAVQLTLEDLENSFQSWLEEVAGGNVEEPPIWFLARMALP